VSVDLTVFCFIFAGSDLKFFVCLLLSAC